VRDFDNIHMLEFQQPLNCCNVTALAYALSALGIPTSVEDIFYEARLPIHWVVDAGMTLQATADAGRKFVEKIRMPVEVEAFHMDAGRISLEEFRSLLRESVANTDDIHILNFRVSVAHGIPSLQGGHFSLLADYDEDSDKVVIADTHPKKYGKMWSTTSEAMYLACSDVDASVGRARGYITVRRTGAANS